MRILEIAPPYQPILGDRYGGIERVVVSRAAALARRGHDVTLLAPGVRAPEGVRHLPLRTVGSPQRASSLTIVHWVVTSKSFRYLGPYLRVLPGLDEGFDVVLNDALRFEPWTGMFFLLALEQTQAVHVLHAEFALAARNRRWLDPHFARLRFGILSRGQLAVARGLGFRAEYTPNGIEVPSADQVVTEPDERLVFVGRLDRFKAPHLAIEVAARAGVPIDLIGPVRDPSYFAREVAPRLGGRARYLGELPRSELTETLRRARALVFTSQFEDAQPAVLQEALSFGVPVLGLTTSRSGGFWDTVEPGVNGVSCTTLDDVPAAYRALTELDRRELHRATVRTWSWDAVTERTLEPLLERLRKGVGAADPTNSQGSVA